MKKTLKKAFLFLLCISILLCVNTNRQDFEPVSARTIFDIEEEIDEYEDILDDLQSKLSKVSKELDGIEDAASDKEAAFLKKQLELAELEAELATNTAILDSYDFRISEVLAKKVLAQEDYDYRLSMYKNLMQFIYENGEPSAFEILFSSQNFSDYLTRRDNYNDIMNAANEIMKDINVSIEELGVLEAELAETKAVYEEQINTIKANNETISAEMESIQSDIDNLGVNEEDLSSQVKDLNSEIKSVKKKIKELKSERQKYYDAQTGYKWPVATGSYRVTSQFGTRNDPFGKPNTEFHKGIDIACSKGTPILAMKDGTVTHASWKGGYGNCVIVYHGGGISTLYAHCDNATSSRPIYEVKVGDHVKAGQIIAYVGTTGRSTGYHLHLSVLENGAYVNPNKYLPDGYYTKRN